MTPVCHNPRGPAATVVRPLAGRHIRDRKRHLRLSNRLSPCYISRARTLGGAPISAGWSSPVARQAHNLKVVGSNPTPATKKSPANQPLRARLPGFFLPRRGCRSDYRYVSISWVLGDVPCGPVGSACCPSGAPQDLRALPRRSPTRLRSRLVGSRHSGSAKASRTSERVRPGSPGYAHRRTPGWRRRGGCAKPEPASSRNLPRLRPKPRTSRRSPECSPNALLKSSWHPPSGCERGGLPVRSPQGRSRCRRSDRSRAVFFGDCQPARAGRGRLRKVAGKSASDGSNLQSVDQMSGKKAADVLQRSLSGGSVKLDPIVAALALRKMRGIKVMMHPG